MPEIEDRISALETTVALLKESITELAKQGPLNLANDKFSDARFFALYSIVMDLAKREGISPEEFARHHKKREQHFHERLLQKVEDRDPTLAAEIDKRSIDSVPTSDRYPPLFPE
jgi:hypothetical protein